MRVCASSSTNRAVSTSPDDGASTYVSASFSSAFERSTTSRNVSADSTSSGIEPGTVGSSGTAPKVDGSSKNVKAASPTPAGVEESERVDR
jgi:hypothetical protein